MTINTERLRQIEQLYHAALDQPEHERQAFLAAACAGRDDIRREVESLLQYQPRSSGFMEAAASADPALSRIVDAVRKSGGHADAGRLVGRVLGAYEVTALIAVGGMGEVYRARDRRLERTVAIKILPEHLAADHERRLRFAREARIISSLNHPHICALYDIGEDEGLHFLVMEHLDGETLEQMLGRGPLPAARAVELLTQIAQALDAAHRRGVVHRDFKPANVMLTREGVKLLDFGVAAYAAPDAAAGAVFGADAAGGAPDLPQLTEAGRIVGTCAYMAPEQLRGQRPDPRTDIFAFGAVAYELLTGTRAFAGGSPAEVIGAVLRDEPAGFGSRGASVPLVLERVVMRCLAKDPAERWQSVGDLLFALRAWQLAPDPAPVPGAGSPRSSRWTERAFWAALAAAAALVAFVVAPGSGERAAVPAEAAVQFQVAPAEGVHLFGSDIPFALSPDGRQIVYAGTAVDGTRQLWHRSLISGEHRPLPGSLGATSPFWSPDSEWVGFFAGSTLSKVRVSTGLGQVIARNVTTIGGAAWSAGGDIIFPQHSGGLTRVSNDGREVGRVPLEPGSQLYPQFLADGRHFIYASGRTTEIRLARLDGGQPQTLLSFPVRISAVAYARGTVFYVEDGTLFARSFDEGRLAFSGPAIRIVDGIPLTTPGRTPFSVAEGGVLAYWTYPVGTPAALRWRTRDGRPAGTVVAPAQYRGFALSPDGRQLLLARIGRSGGADLWLREIGSGRETQLTFDGAAFAPQWSPDGRRIAFSGYANQPPPNLFIKDLTVQGAAAQAGRVPTPEFASSWGRDGAIITVRTQDAANGHDLWMRSGPAAVAERLSVNTSSYEFQGRLSPDGRWLAYVSDRNGRDEVWVARMPEAADPQRVSAGGATMPEWSADGRELLYVSDERALMSVALDPAADRWLDRPRLVLPLPQLIDVDREVWPTVNAYSVAADGRIVLAEREPDPEAPPISIIANWPALMRP